MAAHKLSEMEPKSDFASLPMSLTTHHLLPVEEVETEPEDSNIVHKLPKMQEEEEEDEAKEADTSMAAHKLSEMESKSEFLSLPTSLASHHLLPVEWPETGILTSMVAHQIIHLCPEDLDREVSS